MMAPLLAKILHYAYVYAYEALRASEPPIHWSETVKLNSCTHGELIFCWQSVILLTVTSIQSNQQMKNY